MKPAWLEIPAQPLDQPAAKAAAARQVQLTKPPGSLGRLESIAVRLAAMQGRERPSLEQVRIAVFAGDHGVTDEGISAFPQAVTVEMIRNFARGGAAISVLARVLKAELEVVDVGAATDPGEAGVVSRRVGAGTGNFCQGPAMGPEQLAAALDAGRDAVRRAVEAGAQLFIGGEMGIGNTTAAAALTAAFTGASPSDVAGPGTGLDVDGLSRKVRVLERALTLHRPALTDAWETLRRLGGFEIAALAGAYIACAQQGLSVLVDGFIATTAALAACRLHAGVGEWLIYSHCSAEPGHKVVLEALSAEPLLDLGMRLGEGSGAAVAVPLLRLAVQLHDGMATFEEAGVSGA